MSCKKLNTTFNVSDIILLEEYIRYGRDEDGKFRGITYSNFTANDLRQFYDLVPKEHQPKFSISLMQVRGNIPPHTDSGVSAVVNFYVTTNNCTTQFYDFKDSDTGAFQVGNQTNGFVFDADKLNATESFQAESGDVWILDVSKPHAVIEPSSAAEPRMAICLSTNAFSFQELVDLLS